MGRAPGWVSAGPEPLSTPCRKSPTVTVKKEEEKKPHIKKPLNAFMLYMKEMRAKVVAECTLKESAAINQILGRRVWPWPAVAVAWGPHGSGPLLGVLPAQEVPGSWWELVAMGWCGLGA